MPAPDSRRHCDGGVCARPDVAAPGSQRELHVRSGSVDGAWPGPQMPLVTTAEMVGATHRDGCGITASASSRTPPDPLACGDAPDDSRPPPPIRPPGERSSPVLAAVLVVVAGRRGRRTISVACTPAISPGSDQNSLNRAVPAVLADGGSVLIIDERVADAFGARGRPAALPLRLGGKP